MIEIRDINDEDSLTQWLQQWPRANGKSKDEARAIAVTIAHRAAMRILPGRWVWTLRDAARKSGLTALTDLRCNLISGVAAFVSTPEIKLAATTAAFDAVDATNNAAALAASVVEAVNAATMSAAAAANAAATNAAALWNEIRTDCITLSRENDVFSTPLWPNRRNPLVSDWTSVKTYFTAPEWSFWIKWYDDALAGVPQNWKMLEQIALIDPEVWDAGAEVVSQEIARIELDFAVQTTPNAEDIRINEDGKYQAYPRSTLPGKTLRDANQRIGDVIRQIRAAQNDNQYTPLSPEADLLEETQTRYGDNALRLYEVCHKVARHIGQHVTDGLMPEDNNLIGDVTGDLQNNADDIYNFDAEVKESVDARARLRFDRMSDAKLDQVIALTEGIAERSEDQLAQELRDDVQAIRDDAEPSEDNASIWYRLGSRLVRVVALGGKLLKDVGQALIVLDDIGGGLVVFWSIIRVLLGL